MWTRDTQNSQKTTAAPGHESRGRWLSRLPSNAPWRCPAVAVPNPTSDTPMHATSPLSHPLNTPLDAAPGEALIRHVAHQLTTTAGLTITDAQGKRLCGLESGVWDQVVTELMVRGVLVSSSSSTYVISRTITGAARTGPYAGRERRCHVPDGPGAR
jgi:hypothetical protein